jgi:hypothetical protein
MRLNSSWYQGFVLIGRWLAFRLDLISATTLAGGAVMGAALRGRVPVSLLGLALSYVLQLPGLMQWTVRQSTEVGGLASWGCEGLACWGAGRLGGWPAGGLACGGLRGAAGQVVVGCCWWLRPASTGCMPWQRSCSPAS